MRGLRAPTIQCQKELMKEAFFFFPICGAIVDTGDERHPDLDPNLCPARSSHSSFPPLRPLNTY